MDVSATTQLTEALAERATALDQLPADIRERARQSLLDWFGVTLGGSREDATAALLAVLPTAEPRAARAPSDTARGSARSTRRS